MKKYQVDYINTIIPRIEGLLNSASKKTKKKSILHLINGKIKLDSVAGEDAPVT